MTELSKEIAAKYKTLFKGYSFNFVGMKETTKEGFVKLVKGMGAKVSDNAEYTFVEKSYFQKNENNMKDNLYDINAIVDAVQDVDAGNLLNYKLQKTHVPSHSHQVVNDEPMCYAARYVYKTDSCHKCYYEKVFCKECVKENIESQNDISQHSRYVVTHSSTAESISESEEDEIPKTPHKKVERNTNNSSKRLISSDSEDHSNDEQRSKPVNDQNRSPPKKKLKNSSVADKNLKDRKSPEIRVRNSSSGSDTGSLNDLRKERNGESSEKKFKKTHHQTKQKTVERMIIVSSSENDDVSDSGIKERKKLPQKFHKKETHHHTKQKDVTRNGTASSNEDDDVSDSSIKERKKSPHKVDKKETHHHTKQNDVTRNGTASSNEDDDVSDSSIKERNKSPHKIHKKETHHHTKQKDVRRNDIAGCSKDDDASDSSIKERKKSPQNVHKKETHHHTKQNNVRRNGTASSSENDDVSDSSIHERRKSPQKVHNKATGWINPAKTVIPPPKKEKRAEVSDKEHTDAVLTSTEDQTYFGGHSRWWRDQTIPKEERCSIPSCSFEPNIHRIHYQPRRFLSLVEKKIIVKYLIINNAILRAKGRSIYQDMSEDGYLTHRSWDTLRNCFRRTIMKEVKSYNLDPHYLNQFMALTDKNIPTLKQEDDDD